MKRLLVIGGLLMAVVLAGGEALAQTGTARGKVLDEKGQGIVDVKVILEFQGGVTRHYETKTNKKGEYTQVGLFPGEYKIMAGKDGYAPNGIEQKVGIGDVTYLPDIKLADAKKVAEAQAAKQQEDIVPLFNKAADLGKQGKLDEAEAAYKEVLAKAPSIPEAHVNLGYIYRQKKDWVNAEASYKKALELRPGYSEATSGLIATYQGSGQADKAREMANAATGDAGVQFDLGAELLNENKYEEALAAFQKAAAAEPTNPEPIYYMGAIQVGLNKVDEARANLEKYLSMNPTNAQNVATAQGLLQALPPKK
jgi:tetratricopeptide (TPR) repeat protein